MFLLLILSLYTSCDKSASYYFEVENKLDSNSIIVKAWINNANPNTFFSTDVSVNTISEINKMQGGFNKDAADCFIDTIWEFDSINIYKIIGANVVKSNKNFRKRLEWTYRNSGDWKGIYTLSIDTTDF